MNLIARTLIAGLMGAGIGSAAYAGYPDNAVSSAATVAAPVADNDGDSPNGLSDVSMTSAALAPTGQMTSVPEPSHLAMYALVGAGILFRRFRRPAH